MKMATKPLIAESAFDAERGYYDTEERIDADSYRIDKAKQLRLPFPFLSTASFIQL